MEFNLPLSGGMLQQSSVNDLLLVNKRSEQFGLVLSRSDALAVIETRNKLLRKYGRIEIGGGVLGKLTEAFCDSRYLWQSNYVPTLEELLETFYYIKNETNDVLSDFELIELMKDFFEHCSGGSVEMLQNRYLEAVANNIRHGVADYKNMDSLEEPIPPDEDEILDEKRKVFLTDNMDYGDGKESGEGDDHE